MLSVSFNLDGLCQCFLERIFNISYLAQKYVSWPYFCRFSQVCNILWLLVHGWLIAIAEQWAEPICPQDLPTPPPHKAHNTQNTHTTQNTRDVQNTLPMKPFVHNSLDESGLMNRMNPAYFHKNTPTCNDHHLQHIHAVFHL